MEAQRAAPGDGLGVLARGKRESARARGARERVRVRRTRRGLALEIDGTFASYQLDGSARTGSVWDALVAPILWLPPARRRSVLILGLGGGSAARLARALAPRARIVGVELDPEVVRAARRWFGLGALGVEVVVGDARAYLEQSRARFDLVVDDVFVGAGRRVHKPDWLPLPGLALAARRVARGGVLVSNAIDEARAVSRVLCDRFAAVCELQVRDYDNRIFAATERAASAADLRRRIGAIPLLAPSLRELRLRSR
jgi:spermidine synthase